MFTKLRCSRPWGRPVTIIFLGFIRHIWCPNSFSIINCILNYFFTFCSFCFSLLYLSLPQARSLSPPISLSLTLYFSLILTLTFCLSLHHPLSLSHFLFISPSSSLISHFLSFSLSISLSPNHYLSI